MFAASQFAHGIPGWIVEYLDGRTPAEVG